jgi:NAD(P)-dependent dehydrogenase (short-subunit alcohol dehydrogenase family)
MLLTLCPPEKETELTQLANITLLPLDVTNPQEIKTTVAKAIALHPIDVVFNNAGYGLMGALEALSDEQVLKQVNTNLPGVIRHG